MDEIRFFQKEASSFRKRLFDFSSHEKKEALSQLSSKPKDFLARGWVLSYTSRLSLEETWV